MTKENNDQIEGDLKTLIEGKTLARLRASEDKNFLRAVMIFLPY